MAFNLDNYIQNYTVHPETINFLKSRSSSDIRPSYEIGVAAAREAAVKTALKFGGNFDFFGTEVEQFIEPSAITGMFKLKISYVFYILPNSSI